jgi:exopolysaccharide production protein ExoZ
MKLPNIQMLRACAAMMIVIYHCGIETARLSAAAGNAKLFDENAWSAGVPLFFAISGFIMVVTSAKFFGSATASLDFMRRRIIRIVPLYWLVTTVALVAVLAAPNLMKAPPDDWLYVISSYLFWPCMRASGDIRPLATPGWTLNLEMLFYVVFAVALLFRRGIGLAVLFGSLGLLVAARVAGLLPGVALNFWGDPILLGFLFGAAAGVAFNNGWRLSGPWAIALGAIGFGIIFFGGTPSGAESDLWPRLAFALPSSLILIAFAFGPQVDERRALWRPALLIGDASYSLYLVQEFLLRLLSLAWHKAPLAPLPLWVFFPVGIAVACAVALATYFSFERPVTNWLNGKGAPHPVRVLGRLFRGVKTARNTRPAPQAMSAR